MNNPLDPKKSPGAIIRQRYISKKSIDLLRSLRTSRQGSPEERSGLGGDEGARPGDPRDSHAGMESGGSSDSPLSSPGAAGGHPGRYVFSAMLKG